ncbi:hypothetical protein ACEQ8H_001749 [Pleosporales sp. CAS-2024a]
MARAGMTAQLSGMASNPYPAPKVQQPYVTKCELCSRTILTKDWAAHKNSKKHRGAEEKEKEKAHGAHATGFGGDATDFTAALSSGGDAAFPSNTASADPWGSSGNGAGTGGYGGNSSGGGGSGGDRACFGCGETGHQKRDCPKGGTACYNCGELGHRKTECDKPPKPMGGGGGRTCHNCDQEGHMSRDCTEPKVFRCRNCDVKGHSSRDCPQPKDWSRVKCRNCQQFGHGAARCPNPTVEADDGGWGASGGGDSGAASSGGGDSAAIGAWASPDGDSGAAATGSTADWADETTAAAASAGW